MYGYDTKSWRNSTEKRQTDRERKEFTAKWQAGEIELKFADLEVLCTCRSWNFPHPVSVHSQLRGDWDWRTTEQRRGDFQEWRKAD